MMQARRGLTPKKPFEGKYADLSEKIINIFYQAHNGLGYGFSEAELSQSHQIRVIRVQKNKQIRDHP